MTSTRWMGYIKLLGPRWLTRDYVQEQGETVETDSRVLYTISTVADARNERVRRGIIARFPGGGATEDSMGIIGRDLEIPRGPDESREGYELRLQRGLDDWATAGTAWSTLEQIRGYCSPHAVRLRWINWHGNVYTIDRDGSRARHKHTSFDWDGAGAAGRGKYIVVIYPTADGEPFAKRGTYASHLGQTFASLRGQSRGQTCTTGFVLAVRRIVQTFKPVGRCVSIVVAFDDALFDPEGDMTALGGEYGRAHTMPGYDRSRDSDARYWVGSSVGTGL